MTDDKTTVSAVAKEPSFVKRTAPDPYIIGMYVVLCIISILESYSASSREMTAGNIYMPFFKQIAMLAGGGLVVYIIQRFPCNKLMWPSLAFAVGSLILLILVPKFGDMINGARRSFSVPLLGSIYPLELAKVSVVFALSYVMFRTLRGISVSWTGVLLSLAVITVHGLLLLQQGLTSTLLFMMISLGLLFVCGTSIRKFFAVIGLYALAFGALMIVKSIEEHNSLQDIDAISYVDAEGIRHFPDEFEAENMDESSSEHRGDTWRNRIKRFSGNWTGERLLEAEKIDDLDKQSYYSYLAQANGGLFGVGIGRSLETSRLPLAFSDYIYSIIVEDMGFLGGAFVLMLYFGLFWRAGVIARKSENNLYPAFLVMGMALMIVLQAFIHIGINTGVLPVSGQTLPFISKGGTSILVSSIAMGVILSVSRTVSDEANKRKLAKAGASEKIDNESSEKDNNETI